MAKKKQQEHAGIEMACGAKIQIDRERLSFSIAGARFQVLTAKLLLQDLLDGPTTDQLVVNKPGAKTYFQVYGSFLLPFIINDLNCVVLLSAGQVGQAAAAAVAAAASA